MLVDNVDRISGHLHKVLGEPKFPFWRKHSVLAAKRVSADLWKFAAPEIADVVSGGNNFKAAANSVGRQILTKYLGGGIRKRTASRTISTKTSKTNQSVAIRYFHQHFLLLCSIYFWFQPFVAASRELGGEGPRVDDVLSSHEHGNYPTTSMKIA